MTLSIFAVAGNVHFFCRIIALGEIDSQISNWLAIWFLACATKRCWKLKIYYSVLGLLCKIPSTYCSHQFLCSELFVYLVIKTLQMTHVFTSNTLFAGLDIR